MADSNPSRARARARRKVEQDQAFGDLVAALNGLEAAQERADAALVNAADLHVPSDELRALFGVSTATLWRKVKAAKEATSE
jgi:hypothetical protein